MAKQVDTKIKNEAVELSKIDWKKEGKDEVDWHKLTATEKTKRTNKYIKIVQKRKKEKTKQSVKEDRKKMKLLNQTLKGKMIPINEIREISKDILSA